MNAKVVRYGIIGLGSIANRFASVAMKADGVSLEAVASRDLGRSQEFAQKYGAKSAYGSYAELIGDPAVDIVYVALTHNFHFDVVKKCLEAKKAVLCEKPLVLCRKDAEELAALSRKNNVLLMEAMWTRCLPAFQKAREWVKAGKVGKVCLVEASFAFNLPFMPEHRLFNKNLAGGSLYDAGVYPIEFAIGILDEAPSTVRSVATVCPTGVDDFVALSLGFPGGALANLSCGFKTKSNWDAAVYGDGGKVVVYGFLGAKKAERFDAEGKSVEVFEDNHDDGFIYEILHAADLLRQNKSESPLIPLRDTVTCAGIFDEVMAQIHGKD